MGSMRLPRRCLVLGLDCRPQLARWSQLPVTGERSQQNCTKLSAKVRVAPEVPHEDHTKSVSEGISPGETRFVLPLGKVLENFCLRCSEGQGN